MYRQANLAKSAEDLSFKILSSIPLSDRFASMLREALSNQWKPFTAVIHAGMILRGIQDMPPIDLKDYSKDEHGLNELSKVLLRANYGREAGQKAWGVVMAMVRGRGDLAEEVLMDYAARFYPEIYKGLKPKYDYGQAWSYVTYILKNRAIDALRKEQTKRKREMGRYMGDDDDSDPIQELRDVDQGELLDELKERLKKENQQDFIIKIVRSAKSKLERVHEHGFDFVLWRLKMGPDKNLKTTRHWLEKVQPVNKAGRVMWGEDKKTQDAAASGWQHYEKRFNKVLLEETKKAVFYADRS